MKNFYIISGVIGLILVGGLFVFLGGEDQEDVMEKMVENVQEVESLRSNWQVDLTLKEADKKMDFYLELDVLGDKEKAEMDFSFEGDANIMEPFSLEGRAKIIDETIYFLISESTGLEIPDQAKNLWVRASQKDVQNYTGANIEQNELDKETQEKVKEILSQTDFFEVVKDLSDKEINNESMYHYLVTLNEEEVLDSLLEIMTLSQEQLDPKTISEAEEGMRKSLEGLGKIEIELYIGQKDYYPYRALLEKEINIDAQRDLDLQVQINNSEFNETVEVEEPEDHKSLMEIIPLFL